MWGSMTQSDDRRTLSPEEVKLRVLKRKIRTWGGLGFSIVALALIPVGVDPTFALVAVGVGLGIGDFSELVKGWKS